MSVRFKTTLRGKEVDVEMEMLRYPPNAEFTLMFYGDDDDQITLTGEELSRLCREAAKHAKEQEE